MRPGSPIPVRNRHTGRLYPSLQAALRDLGLSAHGSDYRRLFRNQPIRGHAIVLLRVGDPGWQGYPRRTGQPSRVARPVRCLETGTLYRSGGEAAHRVRIDISAIYRAIRCGCSAAGYHWAWAD